MTTVTAFREYLAQHGTATAIQFLESIGRTDQKAREGLASNLAQSIKIKRMVIETPGKSSLYHVYKHDDVTCIRTPRGTVKVSLTVAEFRLWLEKHRTGRPIDYIREKGIGADSPSYKAFQASIIKGAKCDRLKVIIKDPRGFLHSVFKFEILLKQGKAALTITPGARVISFDPECRPDGATVFKYKAQPGVSSIASYAGSSSLERL